jgi:hypothetical protein
MKSRQELIKDIREKYDKMRLGNWSLPWFELDEYVAKDFVAPDKPVIEIYTARSKSRLDIISWSVFALCLSPAWFWYAFDDMLSFIVFTGLIYGFTVYYWYRYLNKRLVLYLDKDIVMIDHKITLPWSALLTIHFFDGVRRVPEKMDIHYLDEFGDVRNISVAIDKLDYEPREIAAIIRRFVTIQWD